MATFYEPQHTWLNDYRAGKPIEKPRGVDIDSRVTSLLDILTTSGVLADDCLVMEEYIEKIPGGRIRGDFGCAATLFSF